MFQLIQDPAASIADSIGVLLVAGVIVTNARFPRRVVLALSGIAVALLALNIAAIAFIVSRPPDSLSVGVRSWGFAAGEVGAVAALAAWVVSLWRAAKMGHWGWFVGLLPFVLLALIEPLFIAHPELIVGQAAANLLITSSFYNSWVFLFSFLTAPLLTPLAALVYGIVTPEKASQTQPRTA